MARGIRPHSGTAETPPLPGHPPAAASVPTPDPCPHGPAFRLCRHAWTPNPGFWLPVPALRMRPRAESSRPYRSIRVTVTYMFPKGRGQRAIRILTCASPTPEAELSVRHEVLEPAGHRGLLGSGPPTVRSGWESPGYGKINPNGAFGVSFLFYTPRLYVLLGRSRGIFSNRPRNPIETSPLRRSQV